MYKMGQRVLAEKAGVMSVRYVLPNKHYIPVDMKYIGVDNTSPYVPISRFGRYMEFGLGVQSQWTEGTIPFLEMPSASCCGAEVDGTCDRGAFFFSIEASFSRPLSSVTLRGPGQLSTDASPFLSYFLIFIFHFPFLLRTRRNAEVFTPVDAPR